MLAGDPTSEHPRLGNRQIPPRRMHKSRLGSQSTKGRTGACCGKADGQWCRFFPGEGWEMLYSSEYPTGFISRL